MHTIGPNRGLIIGTPVVHIDPLTGAPVDVTGHPIGPSPSEIAEATMLVAQQAGLDPNNTTVAEVVEWLVTPEV